MPKAGYRVKSVIGDGVKLIVRRADKKVAIYLMERILLTSLAFRSSH